ncbi:MAG: prepilin peptidase [Desulfobacteraceae bacterium]|nr:prepilin peptidase [Pseudomonadota bacterium]MBU4463264.1 prepilin peptidase [Pseudomonadota bacterium]MCG2755240.1 prepilin peptidase [Desulfobacteraceae bacterium]NQT10294.1 prepilin peptidase [Desulfobacteraceae bacterium]
MFSYLVQTIIFIFGMCIGSFLNVCIYRLPISKSIIDPLRSICPNCGSIIRFYDNIPVLSYLRLKGRCRHCNKPISFRYPLVEIISGAFALCTFIKFGPTLEAFVYFAFITALIVITFTDIDHQIIPDLITIPGIPVCFLASFAIPSITYKESLLGLLAGGGSLLLVGWIYYLIKKAEGMGGGDIKLVAMIGAITGWKGVIFTIFVSSLVGTLVGITIILRTKKGMKIAVPFGPFLSTGAVTYIFFGPGLISWYFNLLG